MQRHKPEGNSEKPFTYRFPRKMSHLRTGLSGEIPLLIQPQMLNYETGPSRVGPGQIPKLPDAAKCCQFLPDRPDRLLGLGNLYDTYGILEIMSSAAGSIISSQGLHK